jgi:hypothetical protein
MNKYQVHVDTASASYVTSANPGQPLISKTNGNPFQCVAILGNRHRAIRTASLKDAQIPIAFYNIRAPYNSITLNSISYTVPPGNYTIASLVAALNGIVTQAIAVFTYSPQTSRVTLASNSGQIIVGVPALSLGFFLGFTNGQTVPASNMQINATNCYIINFDTYINLWFGELGTSSLDPIQVTYKIPISGASGTITQYTEGSNWSQKIIVTDRSNRLDRFTITITDRFGTIINNNGVDWSFTLEIESDT